MKNWNISPSKCEFLFWVSQDVNLGFHASVKQRYCVCAVELQKETSNGLTLSRSTYLSLSLSLQKPVTAFPFSSQCSLLLISLTSSQHFLVQGCEAGKFEHTGWDVCPETHGAQRWLSASLPQRGDVQAGHLVLHLRGAENRRRGREKNISKLFLHIVWTRVYNKAWHLDVRCKLRIAPQSSGEMSSKFPPFPGDISISYKTVGNFTVAFLPLLFEAVTLVLQQQLHLTNATMINSRFSVPVLFECCNICGQMAASINTVDVKVQQWVRGFLWNLDQTIICWIVWHIDLAMHILVWSISNNTDYPEYLCLIINTNTWHLRVWQI